MKPCEIFLILLLISYVLHLLNISIFPNRKQTLIAVGGIPMYA